jgi:hypothetical protein
MNYEKLVNQFREMARDILRLRWISNIMDQVLNVDNSIAGCNQRIADYTKEIARANYRLSKLEQANPDYADLKKEDDEAIVSFNKSIEEENKIVADLTKEKTAFTDKIAKVVSGELKVSAENLSTKAKELAEEYMKAQAGLATE